MLKNRDSFFFLSQVTSHTKGGGRSAPPFTPQNDNHFHFPKRALPSIRSGESHPTPNRELRLVWSRLMIYNIDTPNRDDGLCWSPFFYCVSATRKGLKTFIRGFVYSYSLNRLYDVLWRFWVYHVFFVDLILRLYC